ncbi:MAG: hypothetical protein L6265_09165 [Thermoplasmatales archaeon]|nr:hypothetical protein [Thermoplasmatales archaeon]
MAAKGKVISLKELAGKDGIKGLLLHNGFVKVDGRLRKGKKVLICHFTGKDALLDTRDGVLVKGKSGKWLIRVDSETEIKGFFFYIIPSGLLEIKK